MKTDSSKIRLPAFRGSFYPATKEAINDFMQKNEVETRRQALELSQLTDGQSIHGLIVPHAGWIYSGKTAFVTHRLLRFINPEKIALLGPSHNFYFRGAVADSRDFWESPLGKVSILSDRYFMPESSIHDAEHSIEVQVPFVQYFSPSSALLPLVVGEMSSALCDEYASHLLDGHYFLILSTDLSHYQPLKEAKKCDSHSISLIEKRQAQGIEACGINPLKIGFSFMNRLRLSAHLIHYSTSADVFGDISSVVGYAGFWF